MVERFDLLVIGGGMAGLAAAKAGVELASDDMRDLIMIHPSLAEGFLASATSMQAGHQEGCCG